MSLYKKIKDSVIPPLRFPTLAIGTPLEGAEGENEDDLVQNYATRDDLMDLLTTILAFAGLRGIRSFKGCKADSKEGRINEEDYDHKQNHGIAKTENPNIELDLNDSENESTGGAEDNAYDKYDQRSEKIREDHLDSDESSRMGLAQAVTGLGGQKGKKNLEDALEALFNSEEVSDSSKRTNFQNSVINNLEPFLIETSELIRFKDIRKTDSGGDPESLQMKKELMLLLVANKLQSTFLLKDDDYFYGNFNVWLVRDVLLQANLYVTLDSILFFSFLPIYDAGIHIDCASEGMIDNSWQAIQTGPLGMKTTRYGDTIFSTPITHRFWAILRPETLSIYTNATELYFPTLVIDLKSCIKAEISDKNYHKSSSTKVSPSERSSGYATPLDEDTDLSGFLNKEAPNAYAEEEFDSSANQASFKVVTRKKTYRFYSDSIYSARQWVSNITKAVFYLNNSNATNQVLLKVPFDNIMTVDKLELKSESTSASQESEDDRNPMLISVKYHELRSQSKHSNNAQKIRKKLHQINLQDKDSSFANYEEAVRHFLLLDGGNELYALISDIAQRNHSMRETQPQEYRHHSMALNSIVSHVSLEIGCMEAKPTISTFTSLKSNNEILYKTASRGVPSSAPDLLIYRAETNSSSNSNSLKIKKLGRTLSSNKLFTPKTKTDNRENSEYSSEGEMTPLSPSEANLSKALSLSALMQMNMAFESTYKNSGKLDERYLEVLFRRTPEFLKYSKVDYLIPQVASRPVMSVLHMGDDQENEERDVRFQNKLARLGSRMLELPTRWGGINHYQKLEPHDAHFVNDYKGRKISTQHFQLHFSFNNEMALVASYYVHLHKHIPVFGKLYLGAEDICFRSLLPGVHTKMIVPLSDVNYCYKQKAINIAYFSLVIGLVGYEKLYLEFYSQKARDDCESVLFKVLGDYRKSKRLSDGTDAVSRSSTAILKQQSLSVQQASRFRIRNSRLKLFEDRLNNLVKMDVPIILEDSPFYQTEIRPVNSFNFTLLTIGSRGDVQPYIALAKALVEEGHRVTIATHKEFESWIKSHEISFKPIAGNPADLMELMVIHGAASLSFLKEAKDKFGGWLKQLMRSSWEACQDAEILIESPSTMVGIHIAEALEIPYMRAFTMPWTRTRAYPHAFVVPDKKRGGSYNYLTHVMFEMIFWKALSGYVNKWRVNHLGLPKTNLYKMAQNRVPFLYNVSPAVLSPSVDFPDWVKVTGYWFLNEGSNYTPPEELVKFLDKARKANKKVVYIGFGSIIVKNARALTEAIVDAVEKANVCCIMNRGWSDKVSANSEDVMLPESIYDFGNVPHDWLFSRIDAAVHHGGSGTTGASLKAALPTIIKPFFGDQFFYANRVENIGAGIALRKLNSSSLADALEVATLDPRIIQKAKFISERISQESGISSAIETIYNELEYARSLILAKASNNRSEGRTAPQTPHEVLDSDYFSSDVDESDNDDYEQTGREANAATPRE